MNLMKLPSSLVYKRREDLEEFTNNDLNVAFIKNMEDIDVLLNSDFEANALKCMNAAYYICTIIMVEKHPVWRLSQYDSYLLNLNLHPVVIHKEIVLSLVYLMLKHYNKEWQKANSDLLEKLFVMIHPEEKNVRLHVQVYLEGGPKDILGTLGTHLPPILLPDDEFVPRVIDETVVQEVLTEDINWMQTTNNFNDERLRKIVESVGKTPEEKKCVIKILIEAAQYNYNESNWYKTKKIEFLQNMIENLEKENHMIMDGKQNKNSPKESTNSSAHPITVSASELNRYKQQVTNQQQEIDCLNDELEKLKIDFEGAITQNGKSKMTATQAAIFIQTVCYNLGGLPKDKKKLSSILEYGWGFTEETSKRALGSKAKQSVVDKTASLFEDISPKLSRLIKEFPDIFEKLRIEKLRDNNSEKLKDDKELPK